MEIQEIKELVMRTASRQEEAKALLLKSFDEVAANSNEAYLIIGTMPIFWRDFQVDFRDPDFRELVRTFDPSGSRLAGYVMPCFVGLERSATKKEALAQFHRNGLVRYSQQLSSQHQSGLPQVVAINIDIIIRNFVFQVEGVYGVAGLAGPFLVGMMLCTKQKLLGLYPETSSQGQLAAGRYLFPVMPVPDFADIEEIIRPFCDQVHQGFGYPGSPQFDAAGKWVPDKAESR